MDEVLQVEDRFYILATASRVAALTRVLKHGETFALFTLRGDIITEGLLGHGLYHEGTRFLSSFRLGIHGSPPLLLSSRVRNDNTAFGADLTNADVVAGGELMLPRDLLHVYRSRSLLDGTLYESLRVASYAPVMVSLELTLEFDADFADIFEVRGMRRSRRGHLLEPEVSAAQVVLGYLGLDRTARRTRLRFDPPADAVSATAARFTVQLEPNECARLTVAVSCEGEIPSPPVRTFDEAMRLLQEAVHARQMRQARVVTSHAEFNAWIDRSAADLAMMLTDLPEGPYPYAGVPWFNTVFGRDGIITALSTLTIDPLVARGVLGCLAATQAGAVDADQDAEPGKILHETRRGEMAALREVPFGRYYGTIDATPLFVVLAGAYFERTGDAAFVDRIWPNVLRALDWIDRYGDRDGDGFVEYARRTPAGLVQQGWKDSHDSVFHADGTSADPPIALCEVQGYVFDAKRRAAALARARGEDALAARLEEEAERLRGRFEEVFWCDELGTYALALDGAKRPCRVRTSNAGHCLFSGIAAPERARRVAAALLEGECFSGWGIRTLAAGERRYNPMSYHNGSIWPHDNAIAAAGFARYGLTDAVTMLASAMFDASRFFDRHRMPELFCGFHRRAGEGPTLYPVACSPQAWAAAAVFMLIDALLHLRVDAATPRVHASARELPSFLDAVAIEHLELAGTRVDVRLLRTAGGLEVSVPTP